MFEVVFLSAVAVLVVAQVAARIALLKSPMLNQMSRYRYAD
jgi:hypothetical protein